MLLRSISKHVKDQNWFAVFLDFFIVVAGILIAFQINAWSDRQADKRSLNTALKLLQVEIKDNITTLETTSKLHSGIATAGKDLMQVVRDPELSTVPMELIGKVFVDGYTTDYSLSALTYVLNQQPFQNTQNDELRKAISTLPAVFEDALDDERLSIRLLDDRWVPYISQHVPVEQFWNEVFELRDWNFDVSTARPSDYATNSTLEFIQLASTMEFQNEVVNRIGYQALVLNEQQNLRDALENALKLIEAEIE